MIFFVKNSNASHSRTKDVLPLVDCQKAALSNLSYGS